MQLRMLIMSKVLALESLVSEQLYGDVLLVTRPSGSVTAGA
jgi:hypothetical protein